MAEDSDGNSGTPTTEDVKQFNQKEVDKILAIEKERNDKRTSEALAKAKAEWEEEQRIAQLKGTEKLEAEYNAQLKKLQEDNSSTSSELQKVRMELAISKAEAQLASLDLPIELAPNFIGADDAETSKKIQSFNQKVNELVAKKVNESVSRGAPKIGGAPTGQVDATQARINAAMGVKP